MVEVDVDVGVGGRLEFCWFCVGREDKRLVSHIHMHIHSPEHINLYFTVIVGGSGLRQLEARGTGLRHVPFYSKLYIK